MVKMERGFRVTSHLPYGYSNQFKKSIYIYRQFLITTLRGYFELFFATLLASLIPVTSFDAFDSWHFVLIIKGFPHAFILHIYVRTNGACLIDVCFYMQQMLHSTLIFINTIVSRWNFKILFASLMTKRIQGFSGETWGKETTWKTQA
jgi:hypothetical protein